MSFKAYIVTNLVNGKKYVGITKHALATRWAQHIHNSKSTTRANRLHRAIAKYGSSNFTIEHVASAATIEGLRMLEVALVAQEQTFWVGGTGYNMTLGGEGPRGMIVSAETKAKISAAGMGRVPSEETKAKLRAILKGRIVTAEQRAKISAAAIGRTMSPERRQRQVEIFRNLTPEQREKGLAKLRGRKRSPEHNAKMVAIHTGRKRSAQTRAKIAEKARAKFPQLWLWSPSEEIGA